MVRAAFSEGSYIKLYIDPFGKNAPNRPIYPISGVRPAKPSPEGEKLAQHGSAPSRDKATPSDGTQGAGRSASQVGPGGTSASRTGHVGRRLIARARVLVHGETMKGPSDPQPSGFPAFMMRHPRRAVAVCLTLAGILAVVRLAIGLGLFG